MNQGFFLTFQRFINFNTSSFVYLFYLPVTLKQLFNLEFNRTKYINNAHPIFKERESRNIYSELNPEGSTQLITP